MLPSGKIFIGGEWQNGQGAEITSTFSADRTHNLTLNGASASQIDEAIGIATNAQKAWGRLKPHERSNHLLAISQGLSDNLDRISQVQTLDTGKTLKETRALAMSAAGTFKYFASVCETLEDSITPSRGDYLTMSIHEPLGVVAGITAWNSPIASDAQKVAPSLAAGNAIIMKPSSWSPLVSLVFAEIVENAGLPKGLLSILPFSGADVGDHLVEHKDIRKVSFTGGNSVGLQIAKIAATKTMPISLELGGKSPTIVFADANIEQALAGVIFGIFSSSGQSCIAGSRLFVQKSIYKEFVGKLVEATKALIIGHPHDAATQIAPLVRDKHRSTVEDYIEIAKNEGGKLLTGGLRPQGLDQGIYLQPTIFEGLSNKSKTAREEIFGPVLIVIPFENEDDLIEQANDNQYGLACGIFTRDFNKAYRIAREIQAGTIWVNCYKLFSISTPFGGYKSSGLGREKGIQGLRAWQQQKSIYVDLSEQPFPFAAHTVRGIS